jgi:hypothetical protein
MSNAVDKYKRFLPLLAVCICLVLLSAKPASSGSQDWVISITTQEMKKCLEYPESKLTPLVKATVKFEQGYDPGDEDEQLLAKEGYIDAGEVKSTVYEDIFYSHSAPIGLKRYSKLGIRPGTPGTIKIKIGETSARQEEAHAAANASVRIFMDAYMRKSALRTIIVPKIDFDLFIEGMQRYGFRPVQMSMDKPVSALVIVSVRSEPAGREQHLGYGM